MKRDDILYFLNAVYYCMWRNDIKLDRVSRKIVDVILAVIALFIFSKKVKERFYEHVYQRRLEADKFLLDKRNGMCVATARSSMDTFLMLYSMFISLVMEGIWIRLYGWVNIIVLILVIGVPAFFCINIFDKLIFKDKIYLKYFRQFEKEDKKWHRKWHRITIAFCAGGVLAFIGGIAVAFEISIGLENVHFPFLPPWNR